MTNPLPPSEPYSDRLLSATQAIAIGNDDAAAAVMSRMAYATRSLPARRGPTAAQRVAVWRRDSFCCRYCGARTVPDCVMRCIALVFPREFPYHPNWKGGSTHPAIPALASTVDHVEPGSRGGAWLDETNLVTTCPRCNAIKADFSLDELGWELLAVADPNWSGLTEHYPALFEAAGRPEHQLRWLRLLAVDPR